MDLYYRSYGVPEVLAHRVAELAGLYQEAGVEVTLKDGSAGRWPAAEKTASLSVAVGATVQDRLAGNTNWVVLCVNTQHPLFWLIAQPSVQRIADLKSARIAGLPMEPSPGTFLRLLFRKHGLDLLKDCSYASVPEEERLEQLRRGEVAAIQIAISPAVMPFALEQTEFRLLAFVGAEVEASTGGLAVNPDLLAPDSPEVQRLATATRKALARLHTDRELAVQAIRELGGELSREHAGLLYDRYIQPYWTHDGQPDRRMAERSLLEVARELGAERVPSYPEMYRMP